TGKNNVPLLFSFTGSSNDQLNQVSEQLAKDPNIEKHYNLYSTKLPISIVIDFFGNQIETDILLFAISDNFFKDNGVNIDKYEMPIGLSQNLMDFYNLQVANGDFFPKMGKPLFMSVKVKIFFGKSTFLNRKGDTVIEKQGKITVLDSILPMIGLTLPYSKVQAVTKDVKNMEFNLYRIVGYAKDFQYIKTLQNRYSEDYSVVSTDDKLNKVRENLLAVKYLFVGINFIVVGVLFSFVVYVVYFLIDSNKNIFRVVRLHGAGRLKILSILLVEQLVYLTVSIGLVYGLFATFQNPAISVINGIFQEKYLLSYQFTGLHSTELYYVLGFYVLLILLTTLVFSFKEWTKKFD
ncbi:MAG: hypothetical protein V3575_03400, partial [Candidatus Absconditabacteria bacterium]